MIIILIAYALSSFQIMGTDNIWYQLMNIFGSLGIILVSYLRRNYQPMVLNIIWIIIASISLIKIIV